MDLRLAAALALAAVLAGCLGAGPDAGSASPDPAPGSVPDPARSLPEAVEELEVLGTVPDLETGKALRIRGDHVYVAGQGAGLAVLDASDPAAPQLAARAPDATGRDVALLTAADGREVAVLADSAAGMRFVDVTDPREPELLATILGRPEANVHNVAVPPGTSLVYNSRSVDAGGVDVVDASDPEDPQRVDVVARDLTCHDITFQPDRDRAYCAGIRETQIWDVADPRDPQVVGRVVNPLINVHHWAAPLRGGDLLAVGDEFLGATGPHAQACLAGTEDPRGGATRTDPVGAVWFYSLEDESNPRPLGYVSAREVPGAEAPPRPCTAHFGDEVQGRDKLVVDFIRGGTHLVDFSDPSAPEILDHEAFPHRSWEARVHGDVAYSANTAEGVHVLNLTGAG